MLLIINFFVATFSLPVNASCTQGNRIYDCSMQLYCSSEGQCTECIDNNDCDKDYYCLYSKKDKMNVCNYEPLIHKWNWRLIVGMIVLFLSGVFVSGVGIGGGALFVPIMILVLGFPAEYSISSSNPLILGGSLAVFIFNVRLKHPDYDRPLINYNIAAIIEPISWLGTILGVIINGVIPDWLLYLIQILLFGYTTYVTSKKGYTAWQKKKAEKQAKIELDDIDSIEKPLNDSEDEAQVQPKNNDPPNEANTGATDMTNLRDAIGESEFTDSKSKEKEEPLNQEDENIEKEEDIENPAEPKKAYSPWVLVILAVIWVIFVIIPFIRGGTTTASIVGITFCSTVYWIVTFVPFPFYIVISYFMIRIAKKYPVIGPKANITGMEIFKLILFGIIAGVASGFLGIGGGIIKGPMLLSLGIEAEEMAATSSFLILMTSSITSIQFIARGTMSYSEFAIYVACGFVSFMIGINILKIIIQKTNNSSIILWVLAGVIGVATILMTYVGVTEVVKGIKIGKKMGFRPYCIN